MGIKLNAIILTLEKFPKSMEQQLKYTGVIHSELERLEDCPL